MRGLRQLSALVASAIAVALALVVVAPAGAIVVQRHGPDLSYQPLNGTSSVGGPARAAALNRPLLYNGGPVMRSNNEYALFWAPSGFSFPPGYEAAIVTYLRDVAADSGKATNVYSVATQYTDDSAGRALYQTTFQAAFDDTDAFPSAAADTCGSYRTFTTCISDKGLSDEVDAFVTAHSLPRGLSNEYFVFLPPDVGSCFGSGPPSKSNACFDAAGGFCAYHSFNDTGGTTLYANISDSAIDPLRCGTEEYPNGHSNGDADDVLSALSHEANETITDPRIDAWFDSAGLEIADKCYTGTSADFGSPLGGTPGAIFNQVIDADPYILQQEWSNHADGGAGGCEQRYALTGRVGGPTSAFTRQRVGFTAGASDADGGSVTGLDWSFGDGAGAAGPTVTHRFADPGTYTVTLAISNSTGLRTTAARAIKVKRQGNRFSLGRTRVNKRKGTAKIPVTVPHAGRLMLWGRGLAPQRSHTRGAKRIRHRGTVELLVKARGTAKRRLRKRGSLRVTARIAYRPRFGLPNVKTRKVKLVEKR